MAAASARSWEEAAFEWSKSLNLFGASLKPFLGEGAHAVPLVLLSALTWVVLQAAVVPLYRIALPNFLESVEQIAVAKARERKQRRLQGECAGTGVVAASGEEVPKAVRAAQRDTAVRSVALVFSVVLSYGALRMAINPPADYVIDPDFGSSAVGMFYSAIAAGYFVWDLPVTLACNYGAGFLMHAVGCLTVEVISMQPFNQGIVVLVAHMFELSTPFLNMRQLLISGGKTRSPLFKCIEVLFALVFFASRIALGYPKSLTFVSRVASDLLSGDSEIVRRRGIAFVPVALLAMVCCLALCVLNLYWFARIMQMGTGIGSKQRRDQNQAKSKDE